MPFDTGDWLRCPELKVLSAEVRGMWMDMLCYMWESVERGVMVKPNGEIYTREEIVRVIGRCSDGTDGWIDALIKGGVCAVRKDGAIYSRRMVRDVEISQKRREAGLKGGAKTKATVFSAVQARDSSGQDAPPPLTKEQQIKAEKAKKYRYAENVTMTRDEYGKLCAEYGEDPAKEMVEILNTYKGSTGRRYKSDYMTIRGWVKDKYYEQIQRGGKVFSRTDARVEQPGGNGYKSTL